MELILPAEISGKIMTLIDQATKELIVVSPYNKLDNWKKLTQRIKKAQERGINIRWFIRNKIKNNAEQIRKIGITPIEIDNLHCKIYMNEKNAVVTSMNLHEYSDSSSIDIGYFITDKKRHQELLAFIDNYISPNASQKSIQIGLSDLKDEFWDGLMNYLYEFKTYFKDFKTYNNRYGKVLALQEFLDDFELIIEPKGSYIRLDLRINREYKVRKLIYDYLLARKNIFEKQSGCEIDFGNQMKRLKIDLAIFDNYNFPLWSTKELNILKPHLDRVIKTYISEIKDKNAAQHCV